MQNKAMNTSYMLQPPFNNEPWGLSLATCLNPSGRLFKAIRHKILGKWGQKIGLVGKLFVKFSKIVLKFFIHNKKLIQSYSRLIFFSVVITLLYSSEPKNLVGAYAKIV